LSSLSQSYIAMWKTIVRLSILQNEQCALVYKFAEYAVCTGVHNNYRATNLLVVVKLRVSPRYRRSFCIEVHSRVVQARQKNSHISKIVRIYHVDVSKNILKLSRHNLI